MPTNFPHAFNTQVHRLEMYMKTKILFGERGAIWSVQIQLLPDVYMHVLSPLEL